MAAAAPFVSFLLSLLFSQVYELNLMDGLALAGPLAAPDSSTALTNLNFHRVNLSKSFVVSSYGPLFQLDLGTDCIVATGVADIHAGETIIPNASLDMSVCGALHVGTTPPAAALSIRASTTPTAQDPSITCTLQATMDTMGSATPINLCPMVLSLLTDTSTLPAPVAPPPLYPEASPISASRLLRAAMHIIPQLERAFPLRISLLPLSMTAIRLQVSTLELVSMQQSGQGSAITNLLQMMLKAVAVNGPIHSTEQHEVAIPQGTTMHVDLLLTNLTCNSAGYICSFPVQGGLQLANFVLEGEQQPLAVPFAKLGPSLASMLLSGMLLPKICTMKGDRCSVEMVYDTTVSAPPTWLMVFFPLLAAVLIPLPVLYNLRRHKRQPVLSTKGKPVSMWRLGVEDALLGTLILATCGCFLFADTTSVARIIIGEDMTSYVFNLKGTVRHLWQAGMVPLSIVMIVFCGVYPFMKMACVVYFSMLRYQQYSRILRAVDVFGKFSFIVTMVLIVCAAGLSVPGAVSLEVLPSFYVFLVATICLVIVGNYGIYAYRFGTNVRPAAMSYATCVGTSEKESTHPDDLVGQDSLEVEAAEEDVKRLDGTEPVSEANALPATLNALLQGVWWKVALPSSTIIFALTIPAFVVTSISFEVSGAAQLLTGPTRHYSLFQLATFTNSICAAVAICTVIIAPTVMAMFYEVTIFIGSWTAADVILFACVAGLLQLNDYVELAIGEGLSPIFHVKAHLHWPLILLLLAAILTWALQACHYFDVRDFIARRRRLRGERNNREPVP